MSTDKIKVLTVPCSNDKDKDFFYRWVEYLRPCHHLTPLEMRVFAAFLRYRYELSKVILDPKVLEETCLNDINRNKIREELNISGPQLYAVLTSLRNADVIQPVLKPNNRPDYYKIRPSMIPNIDGVTPYKLVIVFNFNQDGTAKKDCKTSG